MPNKLMELSKKTRKPARVTSRCGVNADADQEEGAQRHSLLSCFGWNRRAVTKVDSGALTYDGLIKKIVSSEVSGYSSESAVRHIVENNKVDIPDFLYRSHHDSAISTNGLTRAGDAESSKYEDDFVAQIFKHSASSGGLGGNVLSLTAEPSVVSRFINGRSNNVLVRIRTDSIKDDFKSMAELVQEKSANLINNRKIRFQTVVNVISHLGNNEKEVFYMGGDIPAKYVEVDMSKSGRHDWVSVEEYMRRTVQSDVGVV